MCYFYYQYRAACLFTLLILIVPIGYSYANGKQKTQKIHDTFDNFISYTLFERLKSNPDITAELLSIQTKQGKSKVYGTVATAEMARKVHTVISNFHPKMGWKIDIDVKDEISRQLKELNDKLADLDKKLEEKKRETRKILSTREPLDLNDIAKEKRRLLMLNENRLEEWQDQEYRAYQEYKRERMDWHSDTYVKDNLGFQFNKINRKLTALKNKLELENITIREIDDLNAEIKRLLILKVSMLEAEQEYQEYKKQKRKNRRFLNFNYGNNSPYPNITQSSNKIADDILPYNSNEPVSKSSAISIVHDGGKRLYSLENISNPIKKICNENKFYPGKDDGFYYKARINQNKFDFRIDAIYNYNESMNKENCSNFYNDELEQVNEEIKWTEEVDEKFVAWMKNLETQKKQK